MCEGESGAVQLSTNRDAPRLATWILAATPVDVDELGLVRLDQRLND